MGYLDKKSNSRSTWGIKPVTKVKESKKVYDRKKHKTEVRAIRRSF